ncbi:MAG: hypothetical protein SPH00_04515, partial [Mitsuokella jalaludinii]|nr:hypothetical protein [Mitsuokella jalaludinii]
MKRGRKELLLAQQLFLTFVCISSILLVSKLTKWRRIMKRELIPSWEELEAHKKTVPEINPAAVIA